MNSRCFDSSVLPVKRTRSWHRDDDDISRLNLTKQIMDLLHERKNNPPKEWMDQLPHKAQRFEEQLYQRANSPDAYSDSSTLKNRLRNIAVAIGKSYEGNAEMQQNFSPSKIVLQQNRTESDSFNSSIRDDKNIDDKSVTCDGQNSPDPTSADVLVSQHQQILTLLKNQSEDRLKPINGSNLEVHQRHLQKQQLLLDKLAQTLTMSAAANNNVSRACEQNTTDINDDWANPTDISSSSLPYSQPNDEDALEVQFIRETFGGK